METEQAQTCSKIQSCLISVDGSNLFLVVLGCELHHAPRLAAQIVAELERKKRGSVSFDPSCWVKMQPPAQEG